MHHLRAPPYPCKVATHTTASARPPEAEIVEPSCPARGRRFLVRLVDLFHDGGEAAMAFYGVPIGISDGLPKNRGFCLGRGQVSGCPGLENALGAVKMLLVPLRRQPARPFRTLQLRSSVDKPHSLSISAIGLLIELCCCGSAGASAWYFLFSFVSVENKPVPARV